MLNNKLFKTSYLNYSAVILLVYCFIPFESINVSESMIIRMSAAFVLTLIAIYYSRNFQKKLIPILIFIFGNILLVCLSSYSLRFFSIISAVVFGLFCASSIAGNEVYKKNFTSALKNLLYCSIFMLLFQILWYQSTGEILKIHELIFPTSASRVEEHGYFNRLGGLFIEPGTHANWVYSFFLLYIYITGKFEVKMGLLVGLSLILTISLWGVVVGIILISICTLNLYKVKNLFSTFIITLSVAVLLFLYLNTDVYTFLENKIFSNTVSTVSKIDAWLEFIDIYNNIIFFGYGFNPNFCIGCVAPQDAGLILSLSVVFGIIPCLIIFVMLYYGSLKIGGIYFLIISLPLAFTKLFYWDYVFWLIFFVVILQRKIVSNDGSLLKKLFIEN